MRKIFFVYCIHTPGFVAKIYNFQQFTDWICNFLQHFQVVSPNERGGGMSNNFILYCDYAVISLPATEGLLSSAHRKWLRWQLRVRVLKNARTPKRTYVQIQNWKVKKILNASVVIYSNLLQENKIFFSIFKKYKILKHEQTAESQ